MNSIEALIELEREARARIEELEAAIRDALGRHQVTHIHASLRCVLQEDER